jgi:hypothetical protein
MIIRGNTFEEVKEHLCQKQRGKRTRTLNKGLDDTDKHKLASCVSILKLL